MANIITNNQYYTDIANAIRGKNGEETLYKPSEMANAILALETESEYQLIISVDTGSTVTATKGDTIITAEERNGIWGFKGLEVGEWTISCAKDNKIKSYVETIADGDLCKVRELNYMLYLYSYGDEYTDVTGGLIEKAMRSVESRNAKLPTVTRNETGITMKFTGVGSTSWYEGGLYTANKIDVTYYSKLFISGNITAGYLTLGLSSDINSSITFIASSRINAGDGTNTEIDLSAITGEYYIVFLLGDGDGTSASAKLLESYIE